jgi:hypothetical protein
MVTGAVLSEATCGELVMRFMPATVGPAGVVLPPPDVSVEPPQPDNRAAANRAIIDNLTIAYILARLRSAFALIEI